MRRLPLRPAHVLRAPAGHPGARHVRGQRVRVPRRAAGGARRRGRQDLRRLRRRRARLRLPLRQPRPPPVLRVPAQARRGAGRPPLRAPQARAGLCGERSGRRRNFWAYRTYDDDGEPVYLHIACVRDGHRGRCAAAVWRRDRAGELVAGDGRRAAERAPEEDAAERRVREVLQDC